MVIDFPSAVGTLEPCATVGKPAQLAGRGVAATDVQRGDSGRSVMRDVYAEQARDDYEFGRLRNFPWRGGQLLLDPGEIQSVGKGILGARG
jgi:hypothetical protein